MLLPQTVRAALLTATMISLLGGIAHAGMAHRDCRFPMVFQGADVNVVVLPYRYTGTSYDLANTGNRLSLLVKLEVLSNMLGYGNVGAVQMEMPEGTSRDDPTCLPENVLPILVGTRTPDPGLARNYADTQGSSNALRPGRGLVLVWGLLYEDGDDVFVQTFARFLRRGIDEAIVVPAGGSSFSARLSSQTVAFTPQKFSRSYLEQAEASYAKANIVRDQPDDSAHGEPLPQLVVKCAGFSCDDSPVHAGFYVEEKRGEWIRIQYMDPSRGQRKDGWIHSSGGLGGAPLYKVLPELRFIEGSAGYLCLRVAETGHSPQPAGSSALALTQLADFVEINGRQPADIGTAVALQLSGAIEVLAGHGQAESLTLAAKNFELARTLIPYDSNAITLAVGTQAAEEWHREGRCEQTVLKSDRLAAAAALSADKSAAVANLSSLYSLVLKGPAVVVADHDDLTKAQVNEKVLALQQVVVNQ
jgi:hypothetical protein